MEIIPVLIIVGLAGAYIGCSYYKKFMRAQSSKSGCVCSCSESGCDDSRQCGKPSIE